MPNCADCEEPVRWWQSSEDLWCGHELHSGCLERARAATHHSCPDEACGSRLRTLKDCGVCSEEIGWCHSKASLSCGHEIHYECLPRDAQMTCQTCLQAVVVPRPVSLADALRNRHHPERFTARPASPPTRQDSKAFLFVNSIARQPVQCTPQLRQSS